MSLRTLAELDLGTILADTLTGFATAIIVIDPLGFEFPFNGLTSDISATIDPETGLMVSGRQASVSIRLSDVVVAGITIPRRTHDETGKPWQVIFNDIMGVAQRYAVRQSLPDRELGNLVLILEAYDL